MDDMNKTQGGAAEMPEPSLTYFEVEGEPDIVKEVRRRVIDEFDDLEFYEADHRYILHGKQLDSVSGISHRFESKSFDCDSQARSYANKHGGTPEYWKRVWACNSFRATTLGTKTHAFGESLGYVRVGHPELINSLVSKQYNAQYDYLAPIHKSEEAAELFFNELPPSYHLVLNEARVYSGKNPDSSKNLKEQICGTFDMLYYYDGEGDESKAGFVIMDFKTNAKLCSEYNQQRGITFLPPFDDMIQEEIGGYTMQLSLYALMLEDIGINIINRYIIWLKADGAYEKIPVQDVSDRLRNVL